MAITARRLAGGIRSSIPYQVVLAPLIGCNSQVAVSCNQFAPASRNNRGNQNISAYTFEFAVP